MRLFGRLRKRLCDDQRGNVLILTAATMPLFVGSAGLAIDTIQLSLMTRHLQRTADSGALAGAFALVQRKPVLAAVDEVLELNETIPLASSPSITEPTGGAYGGRAVRVQLSARRPLPFLSFFTGKPPTIAVEAMAALVYTGKYCMVSLDESTGTGITFAGSSVVNLGCGVISNSSGARAVYADGSARVIASPVAAAGAVPGSSAYVQPTLLLPHSLKQPNPFANLPQPTPTDCQPALSVAGGTAVSLDAGTGPSCYRGMDVRGTLSLAPGTYYIAGGSFNLNAQSRISGAGVTIVFTSETPSVQSSYPSISINGGATVDLSAPSSGPYEGVLMHYDGRKLDGSYHINGNSESRLEGAFYFPRQQLTFNGNSSMTTNCIQLVAHRLTFTGNTQISNSCPTGGGAEAFNASWVRLVA